MRNMGESVIGLLKERTNELKRLVLLMAALIVAATMTVTTVAMTSSDSHTSKHYVLLTDNVGNELCVVITLTGGGDSDSGSEVGSLSLTLAERSKCDPPMEPVVPDPTPAPAPEVCDPTAGYQYQQYMIDASGNRMPLPAQDGVPSQPCTN